MEITHLVFNPDGTEEKQTLDVSSDYFTDAHNKPLPTTEERLAALEAAMLTMMGVSADV